MGSKKKDKKSSSKASLKEQLSKLDLDLSGQNSKKSLPKKEKPKHQRAPAPEQRVDPRSGYPSEPVQALSPEELFQQAVENLDESLIYSGKYQGQAGAPLPEPPPEEYPSSRLPSPQDNKSTEESAEEARQHVLDTREKAFFESMVGRVEPLEDREKYAITHGPNRDIPDDDEEPSETMARGLNTPALPREGEGLNTIPPLSLSQRSLTKRYQRFAISEKVPQLNIRGDHREEALRLLELFIHQHHKEGIAFVEVIHGRGLQSEAEPILKPAVLEWLEDLGLRYIKGYAPRRNSGGDYGSLIIEMRVRSRQKR